MRKREGRQLRLLGLGATRQVHIIDNVGAVFVVIGVGNIQAYRVQAGGPTQ